MANLTPGALRRAALTAAITLSAAAALHSAPAGQAPSAGDLVTAATTYLKTYAQKVSGVTLEEELMLTENAMATRSTPQRISSTVTLLNVGGEMMAMRDLYAVDKKPLREKESRITRVLAEPTPTTWMAAQQYSREHAIYLRANVVLWFSDPLLVTRCLTAHARTRPTFKVDGSKRMNGVQVYALRFQETDKEPASSILQMPSTPLVSGRFWMEPATGRIHQTEFWSESKVHTVRVQVSYAPHEALGLLLPQSALHNFQTREEGTGMSGIGGGGNASRITFDSSAKYANPSYTPIDLSRFNWR